MFKYLVMFVMFPMIAACGRGPMGPSGPTGAQGAPGVDGQDGQDAVATVVKLCPGVTTYPSVFVEVALRIDSRLYAVYSSHGGFLTELVPGRYTSNTVGSRCDFTVNNDLTITN